MEQTFKVFIRTSMYISGLGVSVHTVVTEFPTKMEAELAVESINQNNSSSSGVYSRAIPLY